MPAETSRLILLSVECLDLKSLSLQLLVRISSFILLLYIIIIIVEICKVSTLELKTLNKYNTHYVHRDGNVIKKSQLQP